MKTITIVGIAVLALGMLALVYQGFSYTTSEQIVDIGPLQITEQDTSTIPLPPIVGVIAVITGVVLIVAGARDARVRA
jgi:hypothetical protein